MVRSSTDLCHLLRPSTSLFLAFARGRNTSFFGVVFRSRARSQVGATHRHHQVSYTVRCPNLPSLRCTGVRCVCSLGLQSPGLSRFQVWGRCGSCTSNLSWRLGGAFLFEWECLAAASFWAHLGAATAIPVGCCLLGFRPPCFQGWFLSSVRHPQCASCIRTKQMLLPDRVTSRQPC